MIDYASQITNLRLVKLLDSCVDRDDLSAADITELKAMIVKAANEAGKLLALIPVTFKQYTAHDIGHARNLVSLMGKFIPDATLNQLNALEITLLVLSALLHDFGMYVTDEERNAFLASEDFKHLLIASPEKADALQQYRDASDHVRARVIEDVLIADYFRLLHPRRAQQNIQKHLPNILTFRDFNLVETIGEICESHGWGVFESADPRKPENVISRMRTRAPLNGIPMNPQYIAACLRLADIMDFDRSRTPLSLLKTITEPRSQAEWQKHLQIDGWTIDSRDVTFYASCTHPEHFVAVNDFLDAIDEELASCYRLIVKEAPKAIAERYTFDLPRAVDRSNVEMADKRYVAGAFKFYLDYERIMRLLMDKSLYPEPSFFLRELLQNALDACRHRKALADAAGFAQYAPAITIIDNSDAPEPTVVVEDNGVGMSLSIVQNYFMRVGHSYYKSPEFAAERQRLSAKGISLEATSQFGIGILSCFMVADRFEVETYRSGQRPLKMTIEGPTRYFVIEMLDQPVESDFKPADSGPPDSPGTRIIVRLRPGTTIDVPAVIWQFAANVDAPITIMKGEETTVVETFEAEGADVADKSMAAAFSQPVYAYREYLEDEDDEIDVLIDELETVVAPLFVDFSKYDFARDIRGSAWFWLLRSEDDGLVPRRGFLEFGDGLTVQGLPRTIFRATSAHGKGLSTILRKHIHKNNFADVRGVPLALREVETAWPALKASLRKKICTWVAEAERSSPREEWCQLEGMPAILASGSDEWLDRPFRMTMELGSSAVQQTALYGISVPAAVTTWEPAAGIAKRISITPVTTGFSIDLRGSAAATPAASRLFFAVPEGARFVVPLQRAMIRTAVEVAAAHGFTEEWREWSTNIITLFSQLFYSASALLLDREWLYQYFPIEVSIDNQTLALSPIEVYEHFRTFVPYSLRGRDGLVGGIGASLFELDHSHVVEDGVPGIDIKTSRQVDPFRQADF